MAFRVFRSTFLSRKQSHCHGSTSCFAQITRIKTRKRQEAGTHDGRSCLGNAGPGAVSGRQGPGRARPRFSPLPSTAAAASLHFPGGC